MCVNRYLRYGVLVVLVLFIAFGFSRLKLRGDTWPVVLTGQFAPGTANGRFAGLGHATINTSGDMAFEADFNVGALRGAGIFKVSGGVLSPVALEGQTLPDSPDKSFGALFSDAQMNNAGDIVFTANFTDGTNVRFGLFLSSGATLRKLLDTTTAAPGAPGQTFNSLRSARINDIGDIAFAADLSAGSIGPAIYVMSQGAVQSAFNTANLNLSFDLNNHGDIAFVTPQSGIALYSKGSVQSLVLAGQAVPNSTMTVLTQGPLSINDDGDVVFVNYLPFGSGRGGSLPTANGIVRTRGGVLEKIVTGGDPVPGIANAKFDSSEFLDPEVNRSGIVFTGRTVINGEAVELITRYQNGNLSTVFRANQLVEGIGTLSTIGEPSFDSQQGPQVAFVGNTGGSMAGIFAADTTLYTLLFPQMADGVGSGGGWRTTFVLANRSTSPATAIVSFFDDSGAPMSVAVAGQQQTQQSITVPALGVTQFQTDGTGALKTGWAMVQTDQSLSGLALFAFSDASGGFIDEVGANATVPLRSFSVFVQAGASTGVALVNPNRSAADVTLILKDSNSNEIARASTSLPAMGHLAKYAGEMFPGVPLANFQGKVEVVSTQSLAAITLRQRAQIFTSLPVIP